MDQEIWANSTHCAVRSLTRIWFIIKTFFQNNIKYNTCSSQAAKQVTLAAAGVAGPRRHAVKLCRQTAL